MTDQDPAPLRPRRTLHLALMLALVSAATTAGDPVAPAEAPRAHPKTILLGLDGLDHALAERLIAEGRLPNLQRLAERGSFSALDTSYPPQSPVSWAVFNTGTNPGMFGVPGFVARYFRRDADGQAIGTPLPRAMLGDSTELELAAPIEGLPSKVPYEVNPMQGTNWWSYLDAAGVRVMGVQIASTFPPDHEGPNTHLLSGLGLKDIGGSPGSWSVGTDDVWSLAKSTGSGGKITKLYFDGESSDGRPQARGELYGPRNWVAAAEWDAKLAAARAQLEETRAGTLMREVLERTYAALEERHEQWLETARDPLAVPYRLTVKRDDPAHAEFVIGEQEVTVTVGAWSEPVHVRFEMTPEHSAHGVLYLYLIACNEQEVRFYVSPIQHDPHQPPPHLPISSPPGFAGELADAVGGAFPTLGWAAPTNAYKDQRDTEFDAAAFMSGVSELLDARTQLLEAGLERSSEWDVYYQVFSAIDRVSHMSFREFDAAHPAHDANLAAQPVAAFGKRFRQGDAIPQAYAALDRLVGRVLERVDDGEFGDDALLLVASDHGFQSFRHGVNLNNLLIEAGFITLKSDENGTPITLEAARGKSLLGFVDWSRSSAYSFGLGKVYLNLEGREPEGIVSESEAGALVEAIRDALLGALDADGTPVITSVEARETLFHGPWVRASEALEYKVAHETQLRRWDGFADLFVGFAPGYRIAWNATMGGLDASAVVVNDNNWSGGHVSVDPQHVRGVLFSSRALQPGERLPNLLDIGPTMLTRYGLDPRRTVMEGDALRVRD